MILKADEKSWQFIDDKGKKIDGNKLDEKILKGAIILQTSKDRKNWTDVKTLGYNANSTEKMSGIDLGERI